MKNTHQSFMDCQRNLIKRYLRFIDHPRCEHYLDVGSLTALTLINRTAYDGVKSLFDKHSYDVIIAPEGDSLLYAQPMALEQNKTLIIAHRANGLPYSMVCETYQSRGETASLEILMTDVDKLGPTNKVLVVNTVVATRQLTAALVRLVQRAGAQVIGVAALASLDYLAGEFPADIPVYSVLHYGCP